MKRKYLILLAIPLIATVLLSLKKEDSSDNLLAKNTTIYTEPDTLIKVAPYQIGADLNFEEKLEIKKSLEYYYKTVWERNNISGNFLVAKNGVIIYQNYRGVANRNSKQLITKNTPLHIASVSKVLTAAAVLKLIDNNKIELDQHINSILPSFPYENISVRMLLNHRSGLPKYENFIENPGVWKSNMMLTNNDILNLLEKHKFRPYFSPNSKFSYCNTNYTILALIVEKVTGMEFREAMDRMIFKPLKMSNTFVFDYQKHKDTCSQSYVNGRWYQFNNLDDVYGDKNVYSTPEDLLKFDTATYSPEFLKPELREQVYKGYSYESGGKDYGLGIRMDEIYTGKTIHYHNGWWHGNTSSYTSIKSDTISIIALSNHYTKLTYGVKKLHNLFDDYTYRNSMR